MSPGMKRCPDCGQTFPRSADYFYRNCSTPDGLGTECKPCRRKRSLIYHIKRKRIVIDAYGGRCADCGESDLTGLQTDHVNGGGVAQRRKHHEEGRIANNVGHLYGEHLRTGKWPKGIAIRCANCHAMVEARRRLVAQSTSS